MRFDVSELTFIQLFQRKLACIAMQLSYTEADLLSLIKAAISVQSSIRIFKGIFSILKSFLSFDDL
jgi:hypothetical protein